MDQLQSQRRMWEHWGIENMFVTSPRFLWLFFLWLIDEGLPIFLTGKYYSLFWWDVCTSQSCSYCILGVQSDNHHHGNEFYSFQSINTHPWMERIRSYWDWPTFCLLRSAARIIWHPGHVFCSGHAIKQKTMSSGPLLVCQCWSCTCSSFYWTVEMDTWHWRYICLSLPSWLSSLPWTWLVLDVILSKTLSGGFPYSREKWSFLHPFSLLVQCSDFQMWIRGWVKSELLIGLVKSTAFWGWISEFQGMGLLIRSIQKILKHVKIWDLLTFPCKGRGWSCWKD